MSAAPTIDLAAQEWLGEGLCTKMDVDSASRAEHQEMCGWCPVKDRCLSLALADPSLHGIWGGTTDTERRLLRRGEQAAPAPRPRPTPTEKVRATRNRDRRIRRMAEQGAVLARIADRVGVSPRTVRRVLDSED